MKSSRARITILSLSGDLYQRRPCDPMIRFSCGIAASAYGRCEVSTASWDYTHSVRRREDRLSARSVRRRIQQILTEGLTRRSDVVRVFKAQNMLNDQLGARARPSTK